MKRATRIENRRKLDLSYPISPDSSGRAMAMMASSPEANSGQTMQQKEIINA